MIVDVVTPMDVLGDRQFASGRILKDRKTGELLRSRGEMRKVGLNPSFFVAEHPDGRTETYSSRDYRTLDKALAAPAFYKLAEWRFAHQQRALRREGSGCALPADDIAAKDALLVSGWNTVVQSTGQLSRRSGRYGVETYLHVLQADGTKRAVHVQTTLPLIGTIYPFSFLRKPIIGWFARRRFQAPLNEEPS